MKRSGPLRSIAVEAAISSAGLVSPVGSGEIGAIDWNAAAQRGAFRLEASGFQPGEGFRHHKALKLANRKTKLAAAAAAWAMKPHSSLPLDDAARDRMGVVLGCGPPELIETDLARAVARRPEAEVGTNMHAFAEAVYGGLNPLWLLLSLPNMLSAQIAIEQSFRGPNRTVVGHWTAGLLAIGEAALEISQGEADFLLAGGADTAAPFSLGVYQKERLLPASTLRNGNATPLDPAAPSPLGFTPSEGAAIVALQPTHQSNEPLGVVRAMTHRELLGVHSERRAQLAAMLTATVASAGLRPREIDLVCCCRPTPELAVLEHEAVLSSLPSSKMISCRDRLGHALAASGAHDFFYLLDRLQQTAGRAGLCISLGYPSHAVVVLVTSR